MLHILLKVIDDKKQKVTISILLLFILSSASYGFAQAPIVITHTEVDGKVLLQVHNNTDDMQDVVLTVTSENLSGYTSPIKTRVPAHSSVEAAVLTLIEDAPWRFSTKYKYKPVPKVSIGSIKQEEILLDARLQHFLNKKIENSSEKEIVVFSKDGCKRCHYATNYLLEKGIDFTFLETANNKVNTALMWKMLQQQGYTEKRVLMPVILINGKLYTSRASVKKFMSQLDVLEK